MKSSNDMWDVYPLSPTRNMNGQRYNVYTDSLKQAINHPDIHNIAITGDTGVGKTSVIKSHLKDSKHKFASLSLAEYNTEYHTVKNEGPTKESKDEETKERLEKSLLRQIISLCRHKDIPYSSLELVPEEPNRFIAIAKGFLIAVYVVMWLIELNSARVSEYIHSWLKANNHDVSLYFYQIILDALLLLTTFCLIFYLVYRLVSRFRIKEISAKFGGENASVTTSAENRPVAFSLEKYRMELTYVFEKISRKYNAIVFEDMDRIDDRIAIEILTYLREINTSVNERIKRRHRFFKKKLCFIFVINEDMVSKFDYHKYIDYGLSIIPTLSQANAMDSVDLLLNNLPGFCEYKNNDGGNAEYQMLVDLFEKIPSLCDFRTIFQIKNDYIVFYRALFYGNKATSKFLPECNEINLLSFMVYKNLLPDDYSNIRKNNSVIFQRKELPTDANEQPVYTPRAEEMYRIISDFLKQSSKISLSKRETEATESEEIQTGTGETTPAADEETEQTAATDPAAEETENPTEATDTEDKTDGHETSEAAAATDPGDDTAETIHSEFPDNSDYLSFIGFSEKKKREKCIEKYFSESASTSGTHKSEFFKEDMKGESLTPRLIKAMSTKDEKINALKYIQDAYLLILIKEYLYAKATMRGVYYKLEFKTAESDLRYFLNLVTQNAGINEDCKNDKDNTELTNFLNKNFSKIGVKDIQDMINKYYEKMKYNKQFEVKEKKLLYLNLNRFSKNGKQ